MCGVGELGLGVGGSGDNHKGVKYNIKEGNKQVKQKQ